MHSGYTVVKQILLQAIGNHEFDDGPGDLAHFLEAMCAPIVAANIDVSNVAVLQTNTKTGKPLFSNHTIVMRRGRKIGIIGLITEKTPVSKTLSNVFAT